MREQQQEYRIVLDGDTGRISEVLRVKTWGGKVDEIEAREVNLHEAGWIVAHMIDYIIERKTQ